MKLIKYNRQFQVACVVFSVALVAILVFAIYKYIRRNHTFHPVPKIIWSYWDNPDTIPKTVEICSKSWAQYNPDYTIRFLNRQNYKDYVEIPDEIANHPRFNDMPQRFADLLRCYLLVKHGGVWCDSSILMGQPLDEWLFKEPGKELYAFTVEFGNHPERPPVVENWFLAAPPQSPFVVQWRDEFLRLKDFPSAKDYVEDLVQRGLDNRDWCCPDYLAMHHAAHKLLQLDQYPLSKLQLWPCGKGPFRYIHENNWDPEKAIAAACNNPAYRKPFLKMRQNERQAFESKFDTDFSNKNCNWVV